MLARAPGLSERMRITAQALTTILALAATALAPACGRRPGDTGVGRGVLVIAIDALRADHVSAYGYDRHTTPTLDGLAAQGVAFTQAYTTSPETLSAHASLLTGCDPTVVRRAPFADPESAWLVSDCYVPDDVPHLAREFLAHGFRTAAFVDHPGISTFYGFGAGFHDFLGFHSEELVQKWDLGFAGVAGKFLNWLNDQDPGQDWFAYVHVNDLERIWQHPDPNADTRFEPRPGLAFVPPISEADRAFFAIPRQRWSGGVFALGDYEARYDGELFLLDSRIARLLENLRSKGRLANTTVVVVGTYGIGFGDSGLYLDSGTLSDADLHVPLIVRPPLSMPCARGAKSARLTSTVDVAPTLLDLFRIPKPKGMHGVSQFGALQGDERPAREYAFASGGLQSGYAVIDSRWCYEHSSPGRLQSIGAPDDAALPTSLSRTWYGDDLDHGRAYRTFLHDRSANHSTGHLNGSAADAAVRQRMADVGNDWFTWMLRARDVLQRAKSRDKDGEIPFLDELRRRGYVGDLR
jgi:arylsulfatase